jgi:hypothetical protein
MPRHVGTRYKDTETFQLDRVSAPQALAKDATDQLCVLQLLGFGGFFSLSLSHEVAQTGTEAPGPARRVLSRAGAPAFLIAAAGEACATLHRVDQPLSPVPNLFPLLTGQQFVSYRPHHT